MCHQVRVAKLKNQDKTKIEKLLEKLLQQKKSEGCYKCEHQEHFKRDCRARSLVPTRSTQHRSSHRDVKIAGAGTLRDVFNGENNKAASEVKIRSFTRGSGSTICLGKINGTLKEGKVVGRSSHQTGKVHILL